MSTVDRRQSMDNRVSTPGFLVLFIEGFRRELLSLAETFVVPLFIYLV